MTEIILTSGTSWTVPDDCTSATVECIGGGQGGNATNGGNGGDYAKANTVALTPGASIAIAIGAGGTGVASGSQNAGGDTSFGSAVLAKGGGSASADGGDTTFAGGAGNASGGGGGAAGPNGAGSDAVGGTGGQGDNGSGGDGGAAGTDGSAGTEWGTAGSGGGGGAQAAASGSVSLVGPCTPTYGAINSIALPPGCAAGDTLLIVYHAGNTGTITPPTGSATIISDANYTTGRHVRLYSYELTSADVSAGSVALSVSAYAITPAVFRGVSAASPVDVQGAFNVLSGNRPVIITATGITTTANGDMLAFIGAVSSGGGAIGTFTAPSGYGSVNNALNSSYATILAYQSQAAAGATGDVSAQFSNGNFGTSGGVLIALKAG